MMHKTHQIKYKIVSQFLISEKAPPTKCLATTLETPQKEILVKALSRFQISLNQYN